MLNARQRAFLNSLAAQGAAVVQLGKGGPTEAFVAQLKAHLSHHELVRVKFVAFKEERKELAQAMAVETGSELVRVIGNTALFYRASSDPEKRSILLP